ncbi:ribose 5-phosphate isomerase B [Sulfurospirillum sp. T05]|uniref:Ribose 5-phosphate isomerase B n=1 Tax=Sulfurospirillum tamanense TaxID=2813362 RepID=A0ABS2WSY6_9BACT|nr:ribose 5-phosphate isomerase B [Sulfurospirillum tamanensis]MBN2964771.1 ribose 5-phosphate isomerase B [Sulfurospirillum tamanensis]
MKFYIGTDHAGFAIKKDVIALLKTHGCKVEDLGPATDERVDYPDFGHKVALAVLKDTGSFGIVICGTGIGISLAANKHEGIRAALCHDAYTAQMARAHNNANILAFGQRIVGLGVIESMLDAFISTPFEGGRHATRVDKIEC